MLRLQAENAEQRLHDLLVNNPLAYIAIDQDWQITFANRQAAEVNRKRMEEFVGKNIWDTWPELIGTEVERQYRSVMEARVPVQFEFFNPLIAAWFEINVYPTREGIGFYYQDITQHRRAEEDLKKSQQETERQRAELESLYQTAPIGLALFDPVEFRYLRLNDKQAEIVGLPPEKILGKTVTEIAPIDGLHEMFCQVAAREPVRDMLLEGELPMQPGVHRYWAVNYYPVYAPDGSVQAITAASLEITSQKRAEMALIQSEKLAAVGRLASSISHEINNPLEAVTNLLYLTSAHPQIPEEVQGYVRSAQNELARVSQIATQTLRFHRQTMKPTWIGAGELMNSVLDLYQGRLFNSSIQIHAAYKSTGRMLCFESDIRQVLNNLIANAIDAMRQGGHLLLGTHDATDWKTGRKGVRFTIADTGHGMSREVKNRLFEAFYTTKALNGTGLGLWISRGIVSRHRGRLTVRSSEKPSKSGTVFTLFLPDSKDSDIPER